MKGFVKVDKNIERLGAQAISIQAIFDNCTHCEAVRKACIGFRWPNLSDKSGILLMYVSGIQMEYYHKLIDELNKVTAA